MRKITALLLVYMVLLAGCQATPERPIVIQKDLEQMLDTASKNEPENASQSLAAQYGIPTEYSWDAQGADGKFNIRVDAAVIIPASSRMPIYRIKAVNFTQEQVTAFWNALVGDTEMWQVQGVQTKAQIQEEILWIKNRIDDYSPEEAQAQLQYLEEQYKNAPETVAETRADSMLQETYFAETGGTYTSINARENTGSAKVNGKSFSVANNDDRTEGSAIYKISRQANLSYSNEAIRYSGMYDYTSAIPVTADTVLEQELMDKTGLSPANAIAQVQALLDQTGSGMRVHRAWLLVNEMVLSMDGADGMAVRPAEKYTYTIACVRVVEGIPLSYNNDFSAGEQDDAMTSIWGYETLDCVVNKNGIVNLSWNAPLAIIETVKEDSQLKPFSEIREIFEKMMFVKYEAAAEASLAYAFEIDRVELSLHRIAEQNSHENGLLIPVWNFYGKATQAYTKDVSYATQNQSVMSINAIDGSVIDVRKGY